MSEKKLLRNIGEIDDKFIEESAPKRKDKISIYKWVGVAAGICVVCTLAVLISKGIGSTKNNNGDKVKNDIDNPVIEDNHQEHNEMAVEPSYAPDEPVDNATQNGETIPCDNPEYMVEVTFTVKDSDGNPMKNIAYHLEFVSGEKGNYQPGQGITDSTGTFTRKVHPNAEYVLYLQKKNAVIYADYQRYPEHKEIVYEEAAINIKVDEAFSMDIVWDDEKTTVSSPKSQMNIDVTDLYEGPYEDVFFQLISEYGAQIQIGYLEDDGIIIWKDGYDGWYYLQLQMFEDTEHGDSLTMNKSYRVELEDGKIIVDKDWDGKMEVLE